MNPTIVRGAHLYPAANGAWRFVDATGRFIRIDGVTAPLSELQEFLHGHRAGGVDSLSVDAQEALRRLQDAGLVAVQGPPPDLTGKIVAVDGDNPVADCLVDLLGREIPVVRLAAAGPESTSADCDVRVSCAGWLPDARWQQVDRLCEEDGRPWHRVYVEGECLVLGPLSVPGRTANYAHTRARILAAAPHADEVRQFWRYLDSSVRLPTVRWPPTGVCAVAAGLVCADVLGLLTGGRVPTLGKQVVVDGGDATVTHHEVLPLPDAWELT